MSLSAFALTITLCYSKNAPEVEISALDSMKIIWMVLFVASFAVGIGAIPWLLVPELFTSHHRASAMSISTAINWVSNFIIGLCFPFLQKYLQNLSFLPFGCVCFCVWLFTLRYIIETKGKTETQVQEDLHRKQCSLGWLDDENGVVDKSNVHPNHESDCETKRLIH